MNGIALLLLALNPVETGVLEDRALVQEVNHFFDEEGRLVFDQLICWEHGPSGEDERVFAWRLIKTPSMLPQYDWKRKVWVTTFMDGEYTRRIESPCFRETWTQSCYEGDREQNDRAFYPKELRRELRKPRSGRADPWP